MDHFQAASMIITPTFTTSTICHSCEPSEERRQLGSVVPLGLVRVQVELGAQVEVEEGVNAEHKDEDGSHQQEGIPES